MSLKLACPRKEFAQAVSLAQAASSGRSPLGILHNVKIEAKDGGIRVSGCDGEMWVERDLACMVQEPGSVCVQANLLNQVVSSLPDGDLELRMLDANGMMLQQGASEYRMLTLDAADFPPTPAFDGQGELSMNMGTLRDAVDSVLFAVSTESHRQTLTGVLLNYDGHTLTLVATDTHRLAVRRLNLEGIGASIQAVVPERALRAIKALPVDDDSEITLKFGDRRVGVEAGGAKVVSQLLDGNYPNWERVVPSESTRSWTVECDQLQDNVKRVLILAKDNAYRIRFKGDGNILLLEARSDERGDAKEEIPMVANNGDMEIAFNGTYVRDAVAPIKSAGVRVEMTESSRPAVFRPADGDVDYFCVIMPMALA